MPVLILSPREVLVLWARVVTQNMAKPILVVTSVCPPLETVPFTRLHPEHVMSLPIAQSMGMRAECVCWLHFE